MKYIISENRLDSIIKRYIDTFIGKIHEKTSEEMGIPYKSEKVYFINDNGTKIFSYFLGKISINEKLFKSVKEMFNFRGDSDITHLKVGEKLINFFEEKFPKYKATKGWDTNLGW